MPPMPRTIGPQPRDELAAWSTAAMADVTLARVPAYGAASPVGFTAPLHGQDVFVRRTDGPADRSPGRDGDGRATHTWYLHGLGGASGDWDRLAATLSGITTSFAPDLPGSGRSEPPPHHDYSFRTEVRRCADLIDRISGRPVHLVGNSRGGILATFLAARYPELVRSVTLISPAVPDLRLVGERGADPRLALVLLPGTLGPVTRGLAAMDPEQRARGLAELCFGEPEALTGADLAAAAAEFADRKRAPWIGEATVRSLRSLIRAQLRPGRWSFSAAARSVAVPTLVVWGARDRLVDVRLSRRAAAAFPDSRLLVLPRTGHVAQMERPTETARAMVALWRTVSRTVSRTASGAVSGAPPARSASPVAT